MKITDGRKTVSIEIRNWDGTSYGPDWSTDYFDAASLLYDADRDAYTVSDVDYCIDMANSTESEGARCKIDKNGDVVEDDTVNVLVEEL